MYSVLGLKAGKEVAVLLLHVCVCFRQKYLMSAQDQILFTLVSGTLRQRTGMGRERNMSLMLCLSAPDTTVTLMFL